VIPRTPGRNAEPDVLPRRKEGLIVEEVENETIVYDPKVDRMHCLNPTAALVFRHCDGATPVDQVSKRLSQRLGVPMDATVVNLTLHRLSRARLIEPLPGAPVNAISRREVAKALGPTGGLSVLLPAVISVIAPTAASAATCVPIGGCCTVKGDCCPGLNCTGPLSCSTGKQCR